MSDFAKKCPCGELDWYTVEGVEHHDPCPRCERDALSAEVERLNDLTTVLDCQCATCGRLTSLDGDCYGCEADRLREDYRRVRPMRGWER